MFNGLIVSFFNLGNKTFKINSIDVRSGDYDVS
jgi:hypothetical protein